MGLFRTRTEASTPLDGADAVFADLDGVVYAGHGAIPHAVESLNRTKASHPVGYITNNASRSDASVARHLAELGLDVAPDDVVTSPQAAMRLLEDDVAAVIAEGEALEAESNEDPRDGAVPSSH